MSPLFWALLGFHVLVVVVLTLCALPLCRHCAVSLAKLRASELLIFGLPTLFFLMLQHRLTMRDVARDFFPPPLSFWLLLIFTYSMFIPNTWRRAALVIGAMALAPELLVAGMVLGYPQVAAVITEARENTISRTAICTSVQPNRPDPPACGVSSDPSSFSWAPPRTPCRRSTGRS